MGSKNEDQKAAKESEHPEASGTAAAQPPSSEEETKKWGTHIMGAPATPAVHPDNQQAALWQAQGPSQQYYNHQPYVVRSPVEKPSENPFEFVVNVFNSWSHRAEEISSNIWHNCKPLINPPFLLLVSVLFSIILLTGSISSYVGYEF